jgi:hypothetical protein
MTIQFHEAYHRGGVILQLIGVGTIIRSVAAWLYKRKEEMVEDRIIDALKEGRMPWQSAHGVVARMRHAAVFAHIPAAFPPRIVNWSSFLARLRVLPWEMRYFYHRNMVIPSLRKTDRTMRTMWKRGLLNCLPENPSLFQLKH